MLQKPQFLLDHLLSFFLTGNNAHKKNEIENGTKAEFTLIPCTKYI